MTTASRYNKSTAARIDSSHIFASGAFKNVWKGQYTEGERQGQPCVAKQFKTGTVCEKHYFDNEMAIIHATRRIVNAWNAENIIGDRIRINVPDIFQADGSRHMCLVEPMIENYQKFNSNTGWFDPGAGVWGEVMQALSHFSYHFSGGQYLLCDLQGGIYSSEVILSDPVIVSKKANNCGPADLGPEAIMAFFSRHRCSARFCRANWAIPYRVGMNGNIPAPVQRGTRMVVLPVVRM